MTNISVVTIYLILFIISIAITYANIAVFQPSSRRSAFMVLNFSLMCWQINEILYFLIQKKEICEVLFNTKLPFVALTAFSFLYLVLCVYEVERKIPRYVYIVALTLIAITGILALTSPYHSLLRKEIWMTQMQPIHEMHQIRGPWFYVHTVFSYVTLIACIIVIICNHRKVTKILRPASVTLAIAAVLNIVCNLISVFVVGFPMDVTLIATSLIITFVFAATAHNPQTEYLAIARDKTFYNWDEGILLLDKDEIIQEANLAATRWFRQLNLKMDIPSPFEGILSEMKQIGISVLSDGMDPNIFDIYYVDGVRYTSYRIRKTPFHEKNGRISGWYVSFRNVTEYKNKISQLEDRMGKDALTGLSNRHGFLDACQNMNTQAYLPLSIVMIDVNGLKAVNDTMGHAYGDQLLIAVAQILTAHCPANGFLARIGGDEFILILPSTTNQATRALIENIRMHMKKEDRYPFPVAAALGVATKTEKHQDLQGLIILADKEMYQDKQNDRRKR